MSEIFHLPEEIKKEFRIRPDGVAVTSIRGCARICGVPHTTFGRHLNVTQNSKITDTTFTESIDFVSLESDPSKTEKTNVLQNLVDKLVYCNFDPTTFATEGIPDTAVSVIVEYYAFEAKDKKEQALIAYRAFAAIGIRAWIYTELGVPINPVVKTDSSDLSDIKQFMVKQSVAIDNLHGLVLSQQKDYEMVKQEFRKEREYIKTNYLGIQRIIDAEKYKPTIYGGELTLAQVMDLYRPQYAESKYCKRVYNKAKHSQKSFCERISLDTGKLWTIETIKGCLVYKDYQIAIALVMLDSAAHRFCLENRLNFATTFGITLKDLIQQELNSINAIVISQESDDFW
jgi:hypothetical protein